MKATIDNVIIEGTPAEIHDYLLLLQPTTKPHNENTVTPRKKRRYIMTESRKKHLSDVMKMRWRVLKRAEKTRNL